MVDSLSRQVNTRDDITILTLYLVVFDEEERPISVITSTDLLAALARFEPEEMEELSD